MNSPLQILLDLPDGWRGLALSVFSALSRAVGIVLIAEALVRAIVGHSAPGTWVVLGIVGAVLRGAAVWLDRWLGTSLAAASKRGLRTGILAALLRGRGRPRTNAAVTVTRGIDDLDDYFTTVVPALSAAAVVPVVLLVRIAFADVLSAVIIALCLPLVPLFMVLIGRYTADSTRGTLGALERLSDHLAELAEGLPVLIGLGRSRDHARRLRDLGQRYHDANLSTLRVAFLSSLALELIATISVALVAVVIGLRLVNGTMDLSSGLFVLLVAAECFIPLRELGAGFHASENGRAARDRGRALLAEAAAEAAPASWQQQELRVDAEPGQGAAAELSPAAAEDAASGEAEYVIFAGGTQISWAADIGSGPGVTTISGRSGAGKTTVLSALVGSLPADARSTVRPVAAAYVPQTPRMFGATIGAELDCFGLGADRAQAALAAAGLPTDPAMATAALSPGQLRRLAIVRVLHRLGDGARLLVLDEPTAHLDSDNADIVIRMIAEAADTHRVILASHDDRVRALADTEIRPVKTQMAGETRTEATATSRGDESPVREDRGTAVREDHETAAERACERGHTCGPERGHTCGPETPLRLRERDIHEAVEPDETAAAAAESWTAALRRRWTVLSSSLPLLTPAMAVAALTACASSLAAIALTALSAWLIVEASFQPPIMLLMVAIVGVRFFGLSRSVLLYVSRLRLHSAIFAALTRLRTSLWEHFEMVGMSDRRMLTSDSALRAMVADADDVRDLVPRTLFPPLVTLLVVTGVAITAALLDSASLPWFLLLAVGNLVVAPVFVVRAETRLARGIRTDRNRVLSLLTRALNAKDDLHTNGVDARVLGRLTESEDSLAAKQAASARNFGIAQVWLQLSTFVTALVLAVTSQAPTEILAVLALMALGLNEVFASGLEAFRQLPRLAAALDSLPDRRRDDAVAVAAGGSAPDASTAGSEGGNAEGGGADIDDDSARIGLSGLDSLDLESISAGWDERPVVSDLDLHAERERWTVLCGDSGTGKTTSLSVLLRFLDPWTGRYRAGDGQGREIDMLTRSPADLVGRLAWCPQEAHVFRSTVRGNLALAQPSLPADAEMIAALQAAGLGEWADAAGLNRWVGDHGTEISGGQRQRLAIARTLLTGADVIILDEPTAHLDDATARALISDLRHNLVSRTVIMVTHDRRLIVDGDIVVDLGQRSASHTAGAVSV